MKNLILQIFDYISKDLPYMLLKLFYSSSDQHSTVKCTKLFIDWFCIFFSIYTVYNDPEQACWNQCLNKNDYGRISSGLFRLRIAKISFHFISLFLCDLSNPSICKLIVNRRILLSVAWMRTPLLCCLAMW